jgi:hypothetical protein
LTIKKSSKIIIPSGSVLTLESDTFNAGLSLSDPAKRAILCQGTGKFAIEREHFGARGWRLYSHPFNANIDLQQVADDIEVIGSGGTSEGFFSNTHTNSSAYWYDYSKADSTSSTDPAWTPFTSAKGSTISGNSNLWNKQSPILLFNPGAVRGSGAFSNPSSATYQEGKITLTYGLDSTGVHLNDGTAQTITSYATNLSKYYFITNPFTTPVKLNRISGLNSTNCHSYFYYWKQRRNAISNNFMPAMWQSELISNGNTDRDTNISIPAFGTILVKLKNPSVAFSIPESAKQLTNFNYIIGGAKGTSSQGLMFQEIPLPKQGPGAVEVELLINDSLPVDRLLVYDKPNEISTFGGADAPKYKDPSFANIYSITSDGKSLSLDAQDITDRLNSGEEQVEIPLVIDRDFNKQQKNLRLRIWEKHTDLQCYFKDSKTGNLTPAESLSDITVEFSESDASIHRYSLIFKRSSTSTKDFKEDDLTHGGKLKTEVIVYPNPANDVLYVRVLNGNDLLPFEIFSITGVKVDEGVIQNSKAVKIKQLKPGVYIFKTPNNQIKFSVD